MPCTIVNLLIAGGLSLALAVASPLLGAVALVASVATIYLRGYLVPGTPALTKQYLPDRVLAWFDKAPAPTGEYAVHADPDDDVDVEVALLDLGVVEENEDGTDLRLTPAFAESWHDAIERLRDGEAARFALADLLGVDEDRVALTARGSAVAAAVDGEEVGRWESRAAFVADVAAERVLGGRVSGWTELSIERRSRLLSSLRVFLERCPDCDGRVAIREETVESCCRSRRVVAGACQNCGTRLFEIDAADIDGEG